MQSSKYLARPDRAGLRGLAVQRLRERVVDALDLRRVGVLAPEVFEEVDALEELALVLQNAAHARIAGERRVGGGAVDQVGPLVLVGLRDVGVKPFPRQNVGRSPRSRRICARTWSSRFVTGARSAWRVGQAAEDPSVRVPFPMKLASPNSNREREMHGRAT